MIMKQVLKNREKSLHSEEFEAGAYEDDQSWILIKPKPWNVEPEEKSHNETQLYYFPIAIAC